MIADQNSRPRPCRPNQGPGTVPLYSYVEIPVGTVLRDQDFHPWVFTGWIPRQAGGVSAIFVKANVRGFYRSPQWNFTVVYYETLLRKFPDAIKLNGRKST